jgi:ABC-type Na+ efflux pump permease subunit
MDDLATMLWKEAAELMGNRRYLRVFTLAVLALGILPGLAQPPAAPEPLLRLFLLLRLAYVLLAAVIMVAQTAPDLVLHERVGRTLDYLLATRLTDGAIFGGKVIVAAAVGYAGGLTAMAVQLVVADLRGGEGWQWLYLAFPLGRWIAFAVMAVLVAYVAVVGTFVALRVGEQRAAYMVTVASLFLPVLPFVLHLVALSPTTAWFARATALFALVVAAMAAAGFRLFRREMLALYLQE